MLREGVKAKEPPAVFCYSKTLHENTPHSLVEKSDLEKTLKGKVGGSSWSSLQRTPCFLSKHDCVILLEGRPQGVRGKVKDGLKLQMKYIIICESSVLHSDREVPVKLGLTSCSINSARHQLRYI